MVFDWSDSNGMDGVVQQLGETVVDTNRVHDWDDLADSLPDHHRDLRLCVRTDVQTKA